MFSILKVNNLHLKFKNKSNFFQKIFSNKRNLIYSKVKNILKIKVH